MAGPTGVGANSDSTFVYRSDFYALLEEALGSLGFINGEALEDHEADSTNVHGIIDTANLQVKDATAGGDLSGPLSNLQIKENAVGSTEIAENAVGSSEIAANAVGESEIANGAVVEGKLGSGSVTNLKIANNAVQGAQINSEAVSQAKVALNAISSNKIENGAVTEGKLGANSVVESKINNGAVGAEKLTTGAKRLFPQIITSLRGTDHEESFGRVFMTAGTGTVEIEHGLSGITNQENLMFSVTMFNNASAPATADIVTVQEVTSTKVKIRRNATTQTILLWWRAIKG